MSHEIISANLQRQRLVAATQVADVSGGVTFLTSKNQNSQLSDTYVIAHADGKGASTLALLLAEFIEPEPMFIEIGTLTSRAFKSLDESRLFTASRDAPYPERAAMDHRMRHPEIPAIVEFGGPYWRESIKIAQMLVAQPFWAMVHYCFLASDHDEELRMLKIAERDGIKHPIVFGGYKLHQEKRSGLIKIPTLPNDIQRLVFAEGHSLREALWISEDIFSRVHFLAEYHEFGQQVLKEILYGNA